MAGRKAKTNPEIDLIESGLDFLPAVMDVDERKLGNFALDLVDASAKYKPLRQRTIEASLPVLVVLAKKNGYRTKNLFEAMLVASRKEEALKGRIIEQGLAVLSDVAKISPESTGNILECMLVMVGKNVELKTKIMRAGFAFLPVIAKADESAAGNLLTCMLKTCDDDVKLKHAVIRHACVLFPAIAGYIEVPELVKLMLRAAKDDVALHHKVVCSVFSELPNLIKEDSWGETSELLKGIAADFRVSAKALGNLAGSVVTSGGDKSVKLFVSTPGGRNRRISFALQNGGSRNIRFVTGCFEGTAKELIAESEGAHGIKSGHYRHYKNFVAAAQTAFKTPASTRPFAKAARVRIAEWHKKHQLELQK